MLSLGDRPLTNRSRGRLRLKCGDTCANTRFCLSAKRTSPFKLVGESVQSTTGSRGVRISGINAGYTKFRGNEGYWLPTQFAGFPFTYLSVRHRVSSHFNRTLPQFVKHCSKQVLQRVCIRRVTGSKATVKRVTF